MLMIHRAAARDRRGRNFDRGILGDTGWLMQLTIDRYVNDEMRGISLY